MAQWSYRRGIDTGTPTERRVLARSPHLLWRRTPDAVIVLGPVERELVELSGTGVGLWDALARARTETDLVGELARAYRAEPSHIARDLRPVLDELLDRGVIEERWGP